MATINIPSLLTQMLAAAKVPLQSQFKEAKPFAKQQFKELLENIKMIAKMKLDGTLSMEKAKLHIEIQKNSMRIVLLTIEGLGLVAVENAINAAISVVKSTVNSAIGLALL